MSQSDSLCARCAGCQKTCCQLTDIYVTPGDAARIASFVHRDDFHEFRQPNSPVYTEVDNDPIWQENIFRDDGTRRVLKQQESGDCTFLGQQGCVLPLEVRPLVCRLYPFDYDARGIRDELAKGCPTHLLQPGENHLEAIDMNRAMADEWHRQLYVEILEESHISTGKVACT